MEPIVKSIYLYIYFLACILAYLFFYYVYLIICIRRNPEFKKIRVRDIILDPSIIVKIYKNSFEIKILLFY